MKLVYKRELNKAAYPAEIGFAEELMNSRRGTPPMAEDNVVGLRRPETDGVEDPLTEQVRSGARKLIEQALEAELSELLSQYAGRCDEGGRAAVVRNGYLPECQGLTGVGPVSVRVPKVRSRTGEAVVFRSSLVPPYVRRARRLDVALPWLYLTG